MPSSYTINHREVSKGEFELFSQLLQDSVGRDIKPNLKDLEITHEEILDFLDANRDGKYGLEDQYVSDSLFDGKNLLRIMNGLKNYGFDLNEEARLHQNDLTRRQEEKARIEFYHRRFPIGSRVKETYEYSTTARWPGAVVEEKGMQVGRIMGRPNDPPCENRGIVSHREAGDPDWETQLPVKWDPKNPDRPGTDCVQAARLTPGDERDVSYRWARQNYLSPDLFGWAPFLNISALFPLKKDRLETGKEELEIGDTIRGGVAVLYPKREEFSPLLLVGVQTLRRHYGVHQNRTVKGFSGPLFGAGASWGYVITVDPLVTASPVYSHEDGKAYLLWGAGIHSTVMGFMGLHAGCEGGLGSVMMCGGGIGLAIGEHNHPLEM